MGVSNLIGLERVSLRVSRAKVFSPIFKLFFLHDRFNRMRDIVTERIRQK